MDKKICTLEYFDSKVCGKLRSCDGRWYLCNNSYGNMYYGDKEANYGYSYYLDILHYGIKNITIDGKKIKNINFLNLDCCGTKMSYSHAANFFLQAYCIITKIKPNDKIAKIEGKIKKFKNYYICIPKK